jgi:alkaline phosphatase
MTQMMTGVKTYNGSVNMGFGGQPLTAFSELVHETRGVGVVTSVPLDHATPAAAAGAHAVSRTQYGDIAAEILGGDVVDVWMGGGHPFYDHDGRLREPDWRYFGGPETWASAFDGRWRVIEARADFDALADPEVPSADAPSRILGLARVSDTLQYRRRVNRRGGPFADPPLDTSPTLATMARGALQHLDRTHPEGFFLMVEGGAVDWAMHGNDGVRMVEEMVWFNRTVEAVVDWVEAHGGWEDNLVLLTADHDHLLVGPPTRKEPYPWVGDRGAEVMPEHTWLHNNHSNHLVPVYARGAGSEVLVALADEVDPRRGAYIQDTEVFDVLIRAWGIPDPR